ncbi:hypothetical protein ZWY2020_021168 [Hordeum vulgare]|nr:hypothetical protein ZWY2020_021168 [Hordeum vulgare]
MATAMPARLAPAAAATPARWGSSITYTAGADYGIEEPDPTQPLVPGAEDWAHGKKHTDYRRSGGEGGDDCCCHEGESGELLPSDKVGGKVYEVGRDRFRGRV